MTKYRRYTVQLKIMHEAEVDAMDETHAIYLALTKLRQSTKDRLLEYRAIDPPGHGWITFQQE